jgi:hypothetical protein
MAHLAPTKKWDARYGRPSSLTLPRVEPTAFPCRKGISAQCLMTPLTTPSVCLVVCWLAVPPMPELPPSMLPSVTCRCVALRSQGSRFCPYPFRFFFACHRLTLSSTRGLSPVSEPSLPRRVLRVLGKASGLLLLVTLCRVPSSTVSMRSSKIPT